MPKQCQHEECLNNVWGKGYCKYHQYMRKDLRAERANKPRRRMISIKKVSSTRQIKITSQNAKDREFYLSLWDKREHKCQYCGIPLDDEPEKWMFHHILFKGENKYKHLRYYEENIDIVCFQCHSIFHSANPSQNIILRKLNKIEYFTKEGLL